MPTFNPEVSIIQDKKVIVIGMEVRKDGPIPLIVLDSRFIGEGAFMIPIATENDFARLWDCLEREFQEVKE